MIFASEEGGEGLGFELVGCGEVEALAAQEDALGGCDGERPARLLV